LRSSARAPRAGAGGADARERDAAARGSPLAKVQPGMSPREVENLLGPPSDENAYMTGKAFIPFFYGQDRWRRAYFYKGVGRVVFAGGGGFSQDARVSRVEYDPAEPGRAR
jgi:hypothetical protein